MRPSLQARLLQGQEGDPGLYVQALHQAETALLDCGDLAGLSPRELLRVGALLISHAHMDHWADVDRLLRVLIGREKTLRVMGPEGLAARLRHRLLSYSWNLVDRIAPVLGFEVTEVPSGARRRFLLQTGFAEEVLPPAAPALQLGCMQISAAVFEHEIPSIGYAIAEAAHINVWANRLEARGLPKGPWLTALKQALRDGRGDDHAVAMPGGAQPLGALRDLVSITPGQRLAYITDLADTPGNRAAAVALAQGADTLFIEAPFLQADAAHAAARRHLTARAAGEIARAAGARRLQVFHFSPRYQGRFEELEAEAQAAFGAAA